jgi:AraC-like DNA-binding protein
VFPYRGVFMRHVGRDDAVGEANQVLFFNDTEEYSISHPLPGGDACLSVTINEPLLRELTPQEQLRPGSVLGFHGQHMRIDAASQAFVARLRHGLKLGAIETLEGESLVLNLVRQALGARSPAASRLGARTLAVKRPDARALPATRVTPARRKLTDRAKLVLASDPARRWTLGEIAAEVGVSPVYLTQVFQQVEGMPLYRYQLQLRLAQALDLLVDYDDLTRLSLDLGFSSHSHFTAAFRRTYGSTPTKFQTSINR